ncbi:MAG: hypothetical protein EOP49_03065 [Sphingobacteriales bacterium]|nr:MAG: hypothetical protein EOP49_03065 [Sphingobacteriales bacterium]
MNQFRVTEDPQNSNSAAYDEVIRECIMYDDGFAKIVHANQPINQDMSVEEDNSNPPMHDVGIRLGWEDEQITIWYNRQLSQSDEFTNLPVDAPMGVFGYRIDAREKKEGSKWVSQNMVINNAPVVLGDGIEVMPANTAFEPGTEVTPAAHGDVNSEGMWAPMYYTSWIGKSLATSDKDAADIYQLNNESVRDRNNGTETGKIIPKKTYRLYEQDKDHHLPLIYGKRYEFRVRLMDLSGGGPLFNDEPARGGENPVEDHPFKRYVGAGSMMVDELENYHRTAPSPTPGNPAPDLSLLETILQDGDTLHISRPLLSYPAVVFTGKYSNPVELMKARISTVSNQRPFEVGLPDPDVDAFMVTVEAMSLQMDNGRSENGKENYIVLYEKKFNIAATALFDNSFPLKVRYQDFDDVDLGETLPGIAALATDEIVLPTARNLRITFTSIVSAAGIDHPLYNVYADESIELGKKIMFTSFKASAAEQNLLSIEPDNVQAFYFQPDAPVTENKQKAISNAELVMKLVQADTPAALNRMANALDLNCSNLTLQGEKGRRTQFGCSASIRHSLAPDASSVTLSSLDEIFNHWIMVLDFNIERDWAWNGLQPESFHVYRSWNVPDIGNSKADELVGKISISETANINALFNPDRSKTRVLFLDAFDPKKTFTQFPREINVKYYVKINFKEGFDISPDIYEMDEVALPITIIPAQVPKLVSAGIALTPYKADEEKYRFTEQRSKYLWLEFAEPLADPFTNYNVRVMAAAPDPILSKISIDHLTSAPEDEPINLDKELIRQIIAGMENDSAGVNAMQQMIAEKTEEDGKSKIFMVPLPKGLHANSDELFGFFTYEIRVGYKPEVWSTAQARFGRPLKANGVQHPAPNLYCTAAIRDLYTAAPVGIYNEEVNMLQEMMAREIIAYQQKDVEVKEYKDAEVRKIVTQLQQLNTVNAREKFMLDKMPGIKKLKAKKIIHVKAPYAMAVKDGMNVTSFPPQTSLWYLLYTQVKQADGKAYRNILIDSGMLRCMDEKRLKEGYTGGQFDQPNDERVFGTARISLADIKERLRIMGLPGENDLSILVVEMFPMHNNFDMEMRGRHGAAMYNNINFETKGYNNPLIDDLGKYRIYRTSPLIAIEAGCCEDC